MRGKGVIAACGVGGCSDDRTTGDLENRRHLRIKRILHPSEEARDRPGDNQQYRIWASDERIATSSSRTKHHVPISTPRWPTSETE
jgi:hypothetical protein